jgi:flagella basal body P-ring formation protein FlgA
MTMIRPLLIAIVFAGFTGAATAQVTASIDPQHPVLRGEAIVTSDVVRIGDLVDNAGIIANVPIFRAPDLGSTGSVSAAAVVEAVRQHSLIGLDTGGVNEVTVTRLSRAIAAKDIESRIAQALVKQFALGSADDITLVFDREPRTINIEPNIKGDPRVDTLAYDAHTTRFDATIEIPDSNRHLRLTGRAAVTVETVTPARALARGEIVKQDDVIVQRRLRSEANGAVITDIKQAIGFAARTGLQPGQVLRATDLMKPEIVQRNETVTLVYEVPGIMLTVRAKAMEGGAEGDTIAVLNEQTKRNVQGVIAGPGRVVVRGGERLAANASN